MPWKESSRGLYLANRPPIFTPESNFFFCIANRNIRLYSIETGGEELRELEGHTKEVTEVVVLGESQLLSSSLDGTFKKWDYIQNKILETYPVDVPIKHFVLSVTNPSIVYFLDGSLRLVSRNLDSKQGEEFYKFKQIPAELAISSDGNFVATVEENRLHVWNTQTKVHRMFTSPDPLMTVAINSHEKCIAVGRRTGTIQIYHCLGSHFDEPTPRMRTFKWHPNPVGATTFTMDGKYLLSGGLESTLVSWGIKIGKKDFVARLGESKIIGISTSPDSRYYGLSCSDNSIRILDSFSKNIVAFLQGVKRSGVLRQRTRVDPRTNLVVFPDLNKLFFYDVHKDRVLDVLEVAAPPAVAALNAKKTIPTTVKHFAFSHDGKHLATVDYKADKLKTINLKFWTYDPNLKRFDLNTRVEGPHKSKVSSCFFHPSKVLVVTTSSDSKFKTWLQTEAKVLDKSTSVSTWLCRSVGVYNNNPATCGAFSTDGSLLAVAYWEVVTLWNPLTNQFYSQLSHLPHKRKIRHVAFIPNSSLLVTFSDCYLYLWDLLTCSMLWSSECEPITLCVHPSGKYFGVSLRNLDSSGYFCIFEPPSSRPVVSYSTLDPIVDAVFVNTFNNSQSLTIHSSILCFTTNPLESAIKIDEFTTKDQTLDIPKKKLAPLPKPTSNLETVYGKEDLTRKTEITNQPGGKNALDLGDLLDTPSHVLPPISSLFKTLMNVLVIREDPHAIQMDSTPASQSTSNSAPAKQELVEPTSFPPSKEKPPREAKENAPLYSGFTNFFSKEFQNYFANDAQPTEKSVDHHSLSPPPGKKSKTVEKDSTPNQNPPTSKKKVSSTHSSPSSSQSTEKTLKTPSKKTPKGTSKQTKRKKTEENGVE